MKYILLFVLFLSLGCSIKSPEAGKKLLNIDSPFGKPTDEAGNMGTTDNNLDVGNSFSIFLWPNFPKTPLAKLSEDVSVMSRQIDRLTKEYRDMNTRILREQNYWSVWRCNKDTDRPAEQTEPQACENLVLTSGIQAACSCIAANDPLLKKQNLDNLNARMELGQKIMTMVEDDDDTNTKNWLLGGGEISNRVGSLLKIRQPEGNQNFDVYLRFKHFGPEDITYKTPTETPTNEDGTCNSGLDVYTKKRGTKVCIPADTDPGIGRILYTEYNASAQTLSFAILEKSNGSLTGNVYYFLMERGVAPEGPRDLVRFKGNFQKVGLVGQVLGIGAAKFDGDWSKENN